MLPLIIQIAYPIPPPETRNDTLPDPTPLLIFFFKTLKIKTNFSNPNKGKRKLKLETEILLAIFKHNINI